MTTITIKNGEKLKKNVFEDLEELELFLNNLHNKGSLNLTKQEVQELERRYQSMKSGAVVGVPFEVVEQKINQRLEELS